MYWICFISFVLLRYYFRSNHHRKIYLEQLLWFIYISKVLCVSHKWPNFLQTISQTYVPKSIACSGKNKTYLLMCHITWGLLDWTTNRFGNIQNPCHCIAGLLTLVKRFNDAVPEDYISFSQNLDKGNNTQSCEWPLLSYIICFGQSWHVKMLLPYRVVVQCNYAELD